MGERADNANELLEGDDPDDNVQDAEVDMDALEAQLDDEEGEGGAPPKAKKRRYWLSARMYERYIWAQRPPLNSQQPCKMTDFHWLWTKYKLAQLYAITTANRIEHHEAEFNKKDQKTKRHTQMQPLADAMQASLDRRGKGETLGKVFLAPARWKGSQRHMQRTYADAMTQARKCKNPQL